MEETSLLPSRHTARSVRRGTALGNYLNTGTESKDSFRTSFSFNDLLSGLLIKTPMCTSKAWQWNLTLQRRHPISHSLRARGYLLSSFSTMAVTNAGQETLPSTGLSQQVGAVHRDHTSYTAWGSSQLGTQRCVATGSSLCYGLLWRDNLKQTKQWPSGKLEHGRAVWQDGCMEPMPWPHGTAHLFINPVGSRPMRK